MHIFKVYVELLWAYITICFANAGDGDLSKISNVLNITYLLNLVDCHSCLDKLNTKNFLGGILNKLLREAWNNIGYFHKPHWYNLAYSLCGTLSFLSIIPQLFWFLFFYLSNYSYSCMCRHETLVLTKMQERLIKTDKFRSHHHKMADYNPPQFPLVSGRSLIASYVAKIWLQADLRSQDPNKNRIPP